jgi:hypothetical protein
VRGGTVREPNSFATRHSKETSGLNVSGKIGVRNDSLSFCIAPPRVSLTIGDIGASAGDEATGLPWISLAIGPFSKKKRSANSPPHSSPMAARALACFTITRVGLPENLSISG